MAMSNYMEALAHGRYTFIDLGSEVVGSRTGVE